MGSQSRGGMGVDKSRGWGLTVTGPEEEGEGLVGERERQRRGKEGLHRGRD